MHINYIYRISLNWNLNMIISVGMSEQYNIDKRAIWQFENINWVEY